MGVRSAQVAVSVAKIAYAQFVIQVDFVRLRLVSFFLNCFLAVSHFCILPETELKH